MARAFATQTTWLAWAVLGLALFAFSVVGCGEETTGTEVANTSGTKVGNPTTTDNGLGNDLVEVPDVVAEDGQDAVDALEGEGFTVDFTEDSGRDPSGCEVLSQDPAGEAEPGAEILLELDCRQVDWENQEGEDWELFDGAYVTGWDDGCDEAFSNSPDGYLYYDEDEFSSTDCQLNSPGDATSSDFPADVPDDPESDGEGLGMHDGCISAFDDLSPDGYLYYGDDEFDSSYCP